jgi:hypothetical protein
MVGWIALLLGMISILNADNEKIVNLREHYAKIALISLFKLQVSRMNEYRGNIEVAGRHQCQTFPRQA